jgi:hypothetical protein
MIQADDGAVVRALPAPCAIIEPGGAVRWANSRWRSLFGAAGDGAGSPCGWRFLAQMRIGQQGQGLEAWTGRILLATRL